MRVSVETTSGLERRLTVGVPAERVDGAVDVRLRQAARDVRLPGFRPGKVPMRVMHQRFGAGVRQEVLGEVISQSFQEAVQSENLRPAGQPSIEPKSFEAGKDVEYIATFEIFPTVAVKEVSEFVVKRPEAEVTEADVDEIIGMFRKQQGSLELVDRSAEQGDTTVIDFVGTREGEAFEGGSGEDVALELGSGRMIPGFEDAIVGMAAGDTKTADLTFPEDYQAEELAGQTVQFAITVKEVKALKPADLDAELFSAYGVEGDDESVFRAEVRKNMERELRTGIENFIKQQVMDAVLEVHADLEIPGSLVAQEIDAMRRQAFQQFGGMPNQDMDLKSLLPDEMFKEQAERRVRLGLLLAEMVSQFSVTADPAKVREMIEDIASTYQEPDEVINWYYSENEQLAAIESRVMEDGVVDRLLESAKLETEACSYQDALAMTRGQQG